MIRDTHTSHEIAVVGGTPAGIMAAVAAARAGKSVALLESGAHLGGMSTSGLGKSDIETRETIGGLFKEFVSRVRHHYVEVHGEDSEAVRLCRDGYYYEPSVAERVFQEMVGAEDRIEVFLEHRLDEVGCEADTVVSLRCVDRGSGEARDIRAKVFIDATYEGDLAAAAGAEYRLGRESRWDFGEPHAGTIYLDYNTGRILPGSSGQGDDRLPAYTYRLCLSTDPDNSVVLREPPADYDRGRYTGYLDDLAAGRMAAPKQFHDGWGYYPAHFDTLVRAFSVTELPNRKTDVNINPRPLGFPFAEENRGYVEGTPQEREAICRRHRNLILGLLYFLQNDHEVPAEHRHIARQYNLPKDEFTDNGHFPWQLYIREARRICGVYTLSEHDVTHSSNGHATVHEDAIAVGEFPIDSFPCRRREPGKDRVLEGYLSMLHDITRPYQIPYRVMVPQRIDGLLMPVAASTTHVAFSTIRMEPCWMAMGQAAGVAAYLAISAEVQPRNVPVAALQSLLLQQGQKLDWEPIGEGIGQDPSGLQSRLHTAPSQGRIDAAHNGLGSGEKGLRRELKHDRETSG